MRYYRVERAGSPSVVARTDAGAYDLTSARSAIGRFSDLARAANITDRSIDEVADRLITEADPVDVEVLRKRARRPVVPDEVWAAGVTYQISEEAREAESEIPDVYRAVYDGSRPEIFFKATAERTVGPEESVGVRSDSDWDVPEPELAVVLHDGDIVGYTVGNDVSSRGIEGENPLYLPQAKVYDRCCSIGPCVASPGSVSDPHDLEISMRIRRDEESVFDGSTTTAKMADTCQELVDCFKQCNHVPEVAVLLTGTAIVPDNGFSLRPRDVVEIEVENVGTLRNEVAQV